MNHISTTLKKKFFILLTSLCLITSISACGSGDVEEDKTDKDKVVEKQDKKQTKKKEKKEEKKEEAKPEKQEPTEEEIKEQVSYVAPNLTDIPAFSGNPFFILNNNQPNFSSSELNTTGYESYSNLDSLGRCGSAIASCGREIMPGPNENRGSISNVKPSGWIQAKYQGISGGYLWNRCHLIGWQLSAENANVRNLITGTRYMNINGMLPFENMVADYIRETNNHVAYRINPIFDGNNLVCSGVQMEAYSIEDNGEAICFNVYCYNVQPGIQIDYATGNSVGPTAPETQPEPVAPPVQNQGTSSNSGEMVWVSEYGSKYHSRAGCSNMKNPWQIPRSEAEAQGKTPCKRCH